MDQSEYIYGRRAVLEALRSSPERMNKLFVAQGAHGEAIGEIRDLAKRNSVVTKVLPKRALERYAPGASHQGVVASMAPVRYADVDDLLQPYSGDKPALVVLLDGITDPQNLGAILRTAEAVGAAGVVIPRHRSASLTSVVAKHSAGASQFIPVARVPNIVPIIETLKNNGLHVVGMTGEAEATIYQTDLAQPTAIVIGSEGEGLRPLVQKKCDLLARIPMRGKISSLNASAAAAVVLYEALRQRL